MSVAKIIEISSTSDEGIQDAIERGVSRASKTVKNIAGAWLKEQHVMVEDGEVTGYRVNLMITFVLDDKEDEDEDDDEEDLDEEEDEDGEDEKAG